MQVAIAQLDAHLARGCRSLYVLLGDEPLLAQEAADAIRRAARQDGAVERVVHTVSGLRFDWGAVLESGSSLSLFSERQLVEIRIPTGKPGKDGGAALQEIARQAHDNTGTITLVLLPRLDKLSQSSAWCAALEQAGVVVPIEPVERPALPTWIAQRLARQGQRVVAGEEGQRTLQFFADRVEGNLLAAHQEIQKLALLHPPGELAFDAVQQAVLDVARYGVPQLAEAVLAGRMTRVQRMLDGLEAEGEAAVRVHYSLAEEIRALQRVHDAIRSGKPLPLALREQRIWGPRERAFERLIPRLTRECLHQLVQSAQIVDGIVKGLKAPDWPIQPWPALHRLAMQLAQVGAATHPPGSRTPR